MKGVSLRWKQGLYEGNRVSTKGVSLRWKQGLYEGCVSKMETGSLRRVCL